MTVLSARTADSGACAYSPPGARPGHDHDPDPAAEAIREDPSALEGLGIKEIADHYETIVRGLDAPPIIMGHSFGGLVTEILLDRGLGSAGVGVSAAPFKGILGLPYSTVRVAMSEA